MTTPELAHAASLTRTEEKVRELAKEYNRAESLYSMLVIGGTSTMTEDEKVNRLIALEVARKEMSEAYVAFRASIRDTL